MRTFGLEAIPYNGVFTPYLVLQCEKNYTTMDLLLTPVLASAIWIGGGSVGLLLAIVVVVLLLRQ
jgi:hypothetical protein